MRSFNILSALRERFQPGSQKLRLLNRSAEKSDPPTLRLFSIVPAERMNRRPPVIICGAHGGGTSFTTKMLRHCGLFVGHDVEPFRARKFHESECFRSINIFIFNELGGDENGMDEQFVETYVSNFRDEELRSRISHSVEEHLQTAEAVFSAGDSTVFERPWGWKDPRNSVNLHFWLQRFPDAKILMIKKEERDKPSRSISGKWFRRSSESQRDFYYNPGSVLDLSRLPQNRMLTIQFEDITAKQEAFDLTTEFCGLEQHDLTAVLKACKYER